jgi:Protein-disulfide isomerase
MPSRRAALRLSIMTAGAALAGCLGGSDEAGLTRLDPPAACADAAAAPDVALPTPQLGDPDAPVVMDVYEDFACGHCRTYTEEVFPSIQRRHIDPGRLRYRYHDYPIPVSEWSYRIASAARAVQAMADERRFFAFVSAVFREQSRFREQGLEAVEDAATAVGVDPCPPAIAAATDQYRAVVDASRADAAAIGVDRTPMIFIDGTPLADYRLSTVEAALTGT